MITIEFADANEVNGILGLLSKCPYDQVHDLIKRIRMQLDLHMNPPPPPQPPPRKRVLPA